MGGGGVFFFKQKTAYEIGTGDWSSDVCSSDLLGVFREALIDLLTEAEAAEASPRQSLMSHPFWRRLQMFGNLVLFLATSSLISHLAQIGRASCRERV